jgi:hypothetical protein
MRKRQHQRWLKWLKTKVLWRIISIVSNNRIIQYLNNSLREAALIHPTCNGSTPSELLSAEADLRFSVSPRPQSESSDFHSKQEKDNILRHPSQDIPFTSIIVSALRYHFLLVADGTRSTMAGTHPIHIHPAPRFYRFAAQALGGSMWFFVGIF